MTRNNAPRTRRGLRSRRVLRTHRTATALVAAVPAARTDVSEAYTWAVNAAMESNNTDLAYELAASYEREI